MTEWGDYASTSNYSSRAREAKLAAIRKMIERAKPRVIWDIGGNDGSYSRPLASLTERILCLDIDPLAVNQNYIACREERIVNVLPLVVDFTNPSPAMGFANRERLALSQRAKPDLAMLLAFVHHLAIKHNLPFAHLARSLASLCKQLIIEFVPKHDPQVRRLLTNRQDLPENYTEEQFREAFAAHFVTIEEMPSCRHRPQTIFDGAKIVFQMSIAHGLKSLSRLAEVPIVAVILSALYPVIFLLSLNWYALSPVRLLFVILAVVGAVLLIYLLLQLVLWAAFAGLSALWGYKVHGGPNNRFGPESSHSFVMLLFSS